MKRSSNSLERVKVRKRDDLDRALDSVLTELIRRKPKRAVTIIRRMLQSGEISLDKEAQDIVL